MRTVSIFLSSLFFLLASTFAETDCGCDKDKEGDTEIDVSTSSCVYGTVTTTISMDTTGGGYTPTLPTPQIPGPRTVSGSASNVLSYSQNRATVRLRAGQQYKVTYSLNHGSSAGSLHTKLLPKNLPSGYRVQMQTPGSTEWKDQSKIDQGALTATSFPITHKFRVIAPARNAGAIPPVNFILPKFDTRPNPNPNGFGVILVQDPAVNTPGFAFPKAAIDIPLGTAIESGDMIGAGSISFSKDLRAAGLGKPPFLVDPSQLVYSGPASFDGLGQFSSRYQTRAQRQQYQSNQNR